MFKKCILLNFLLITLCLNSYGGQYWRPSAAAKGKIDKLCHENNLEYHPTIFYTLEDINSFRTPIHSFLNIDYGDSSPYTLLNMAWSCFSNNDYGLAFHFSKKCIQLYSEDADRQHKLYKDGYNKGLYLKTLELHAVAQCFFIIGEIFYVEEKFNSAIKAYNTCLVKYPYAEDYG